ncbi:MAG: ureidoglycolate lyase [Paracoccaceae bacterium]|jgi:ureidoglycolate lyase
MGIRVEPLTPQAFAPFGTVIETDPSTAIEINTGYTTRFHALAEAAVGDGHAIISIFRGRPRDLTVGMLERHPLGSQAFIPLNGQPWLAVVSDTPDLTYCRAFHCHGNQGLQYDVNVWHHPLLVLGDAQDFLIVDRAGEGENLEEIFFDAPRGLDFR